MLPRAPKCYTVGPVRPPHSQTVDTNHHVPKQISSVQDSEWRERLGEPEPTPERRNGDEQVTMNWQSRTNRRPAVKFACNFFFSAATPLRCAGFQVSDATWLAPFGALRDNALKKPSDSFRVVRFGTHSGEPHVLRSRWRCNCYYYNQSLDSGI